MGRNPLCSPVWRLFTRGCARLFCIQPEGHVSAQMAASNRRHLPATDYHSPLAPSPEERPPPEELLDELREEVLEERSDEPLYPLP